MVGVSGVGRQKPLEQEASEPVENCSKTLFWTKVSCFVLMVLFGGAAIAAYFTLGTNVVIGFSAVSVASMGVFTVLCISWIAKDLREAQREDDAQYDKLEAAIRGTKQVGDGYERI